MGLGEEIVFIGIEIGGRVVRWRVVCRVFFDGINFFREVGFS